MNLYALKRPRWGETNSRTEILHVPGKVRTGEPPRCGTCGRIIGMLPLEPPLTGALELHGEFYGDIAYGAASLFFSARFKDEFISKDMRGIEIFDGVDIAAIKYQKYKKMLNKR